MMEHAEYFKLYDQHDFKRKSKKKNYLCLYCALTENDFKRLPDDMKRSETELCVKKQGVLKH